MSAHRTRRDLLGTLGLLVGAGTVGAVSVSAHPLATREADEDSFTRETVEIESFDGTIIEATYYEPVADGPHPAILGTHGWAQERADLDDVAAVYATEGYAGLIYDSRGFGDSGGQVTLTGDAERRDASALIDWLATREEIISDGENNPRVGLDGGSYGGGIQTRLAAEDDRVDALVPRFTWFDLVQTLVPNNVLRAGWVRGLLSAGQLEGDLDPDFEERGLRVIETGELTADDVEYFQSRSAVAYDGPNAPTLVIQEFNDRLFPADEGIDIYEWARQNGDEAVMLLGNGTTHNIWGESPPGSNAFDDVAADAALAWLDSHLKDEGDHALAPVTYYDEATDEFIDADEWPPETTTHRTYERTIEETTLSEPETDLLPVDFFLTRKTEFVGTPTLSVDVEPTGEGRTHLMAALQHVSDDGVTTIKDQVMPYAVSEAGTVEFDLATIQWTIPAGDRLRVALAIGSEPLTEVDWPLGGGLFADSAEDAVLSLLGRVELTIPTIEGDQAIAIPPIADEFDPPQDVDGDGLYEDVTGTGEPAPTIADVQALFENLDSDVVTEHASAFNFSSSNPDRVTVFDVQALFSRIA